MKQWFQVQLLLLETKVTKPELLVVKKLFSSLQPRYKDWCCQCLELIRSKGLQVAEKCVSIHGSGGVWGDVSKEQTESDRYLFAGSEKTRLPQTTQYRVGKHSERPVYRQFVVLKSYFFYSMLCNQLRFKNPLKMMFLDPCVKNCSLAPKGKNSRCLKPISCVPVSTYSAQSHVVWYLA